MRAALRRGWREPLISGIIRSLQASFNFLLRRSGIDEAKIDVNKRLAITGQSRQRRKQQLFP